MSARSRRLLQAAWAVVLLAVSGAVAVAEEVVQPKLAEVSLFKNGLGFVIREVAVPGPGEYVINGLPVPVHGTFWILPSQPATVLKEAVAFSRPRQEAVSADSLLDLLRANVGKKVELRTEGDGWFAATIVAIPQDEPKLPVPLASAGGRYRESYWDTWRAYRAPSTEAIASPRAAGFVLLRTEKGQLALSPGDIKAVRSAADLSLQLSEPKPGAALRMAVTGAGGPVRIACLEWGLTWAPSYLVDISDPKEASIRLHADVLNEVEDLRDVALQFVTGFPNLGFSEVVSPVALMGDLGDFLQSLIAQGEGRRGRQPSVMSQQVVMSNVALPMPDAMRRGEPVATEGEAREDLFFYPQPGVTLNRGERGYFPVFTKRIPYEDLFRWEIGDSLDQQGRWRYAYSYQSPNEQPEPPEEVWHLLRLTNAGGIPWTTAPAMTMQDGRVLGQDILYYTASGARTLLKITRAVDITVDRQETEVSREVKPRYWRDNDYALLTIKGELRILNRRPKPIKVIIKKTLSGNVASSAPEATVDPTAEGPRYLNPTRVLTWEIPIEAGGRAYVTYQYRVYVPA